MSNTNLGNEVIILSVQPKHLVKILNGEKLSEIRKTKPQNDFYWDVYLYCTKGNNEWLTFDPKCKKWELIKGKKPKDRVCYNGTIPGAFILWGVTKYEMEYYNDDSVLQAISIYDEFESDYWGDDHFEMIISNEYEETEIVKCPVLVNSCLSFDELGKYVCPKGGFNQFYSWDMKPSMVYAWVDKPMQLQQFTNNKGENKTRAPQSWCYAFIK